MMTCLLSILFVPLTVVESTFVRKNKEKAIFFWFFAHLFVPLQPLFASCDGGLSTNNLILE